MAHLSLQSKKHLNHFGRLQNREISFIFIDERKDRIEHLKSEIASMNIPQISQSILKSQSLRKL